MTAGDLVVYKTDPLLYGRMLVLSVEDGWYQCEAIRAERDGTVPRWPFRLEELEAATPTLARTA